MKHKIKDLRRINKISGTKLHYLPKLSKKILVSLFNKFNSELFNSELFKAILCSVPAGAQLCAATKIRINC